MPIEINGVPLNPAAPTTTTAAPGPQYTGGGVSGGVPGVLSALNIADAPTLLNSHSVQAKDYTSSFPQQTGASTGPQTFAPKGAYNPGMTDREGGDIVQSIVDRVRNSGLPLDENTLRTLDDIQNGLEDFGTLQAEQLPAQLKDLIDQVSAYDDPGVEALNDGISSDLTDLQNAGWTDVYDYFATDDTTDLSGVGDGTYADDDNGDDE